MSRRILIHPAAEISPPLEGEPMAMLEALYKRYGQIDSIDPIVAVRLPEADGTRNGTIQLLSGRTSYAVCEKLGIEPRINFVDDDRDLEELAAAITMLRRHLEKGQRAAAGVMYERRFAEQAKKRQKAAGGDRKSLLVKLPKAISSESCSEKLPQIEGKTRGQWAAHFYRRPSDELRKKFCELYPDKAANARYMIDGKLVPAIVDGMFAQIVAVQPALDGERRVSGRTFTETWSALEQWPLTKLDQKYRALFSVPSDHRHDQTKALMINAIVNHLFEDNPNQTPADDKGAKDEAIHAREKAAVICDVSPSYIGQAKVVFEKDQALYHQLLIGKLNLGEARSAIKRLVKRAALATGPLEKPRSKDGLSGIRVGDHNKILPTLPRRKFRLIFTDPQYNIGFDYGQGAKADRLPDAEYLGGQDRWIKQLPDLLTADGAAWVLINNEYAAEYVMMLKRTGLKMRGWIKWYELFGTNCSNNFNRTSRHLLYFVRDPKNCVFNADEVKRLSARAAIYNDKRANLGLSPEGMKIWDDVWDIPRLQGTSNERVDGVPTQLPLALVRPIILACSDPGDLVLDMHSGSGTTAVACKESGRECLGIEQNEEYAAISIQRLAATSSRGSR